MEPFDLTDSPLEGINLIEASAGTGKTYTIAGLFIRLLLEKQLGPEQILVVTYTNSATAELKDRIRAKIQHTLKAFQTGCGEQDLLTTRLLKKFPDPLPVVRSLRNALADFDRAPIFTIHGFCQRTLIESAFETGSLFDTELLVDQAALCREVADDYWRIHICEASPEFIAHVCETIKGPDYFLRLMKTALVPGVRVIPDVQMPDLAALSPFRNALTTLREQWGSCREEVASILNQAPLNGKIYGTVKKDPDGCDRTDREIKIRSMIRAMDRFLDENHPGFPLFSDFERFTADKLSKSTRKGQVPPRHTFFDLCETLNGLGHALEREFRSYLLFLKSDFCKFAREELEKRKQKKNVQYFDDLLTKVRRALALENDLAASIRRKYKAALIDEFQDTDPVQYEIFSRLFSAAGILYLIGDPKQAIYGFRGADIFSYIKGARAADRKYTLIENYRSSPDLVSGVNALFSSVDRPFLFEEISFQKVTSAFADPFSAAHPSPLKLWVLLPQQSPKPRGPVSKTEAVETVSRAVAAEISRLVSPGPGSDPPTARASDIAVLVRTNRQAGIVKSRLSELKIPAVLYSVDTIFDTHEAAEMDTLLTSILNPADFKGLRAALATDLMGIDGEAFDGETEAWWDDHLSGFTEYHRLWNTGGFIRMFRSFLKKERVKERIVAMPDGERRLTNILHLSEILHQVAVEKNLGMTALVKWLSEQRDSDFLRLEAHPLRLESDALAVKIVTIHKSKGLEYDIVFCPFAWEGLTEEKEEVVFHDPVHDSQLTIDLAAEKGGSSAASSQWEQFAENLRLLYVALTRARSRCYLVWGRINGADTSPPAYLFHGGFLPDASSFMDSIDRMRQRFESMDNRQFLEDLKQIADRAEGAIELLPLPAAQGAAAGFRPEKPAVSHMRKFSGVIDSSWKISSYSSLTSRAEGEAGAFEPDLADYDAVFPEKFQQQAGSDEPAGVWSVFSFPKGARAGLFFHDVIENFDFSADLPEDLVTGKLMEYGFEAGWKETVCRVLENIRSTCLMGSENPFTLSQVGRERRIDEMEFYFPLHSITPHTLETIFSENVGRNFLTKFPEKLGTLTFRPARGFMKGFIDMVFHHEGRFHLVDWKSNYLGPRIENYTGSFLSEIMAADFYVLQYHLYTLALHQYLKTRMPNYRYLSHFGGVYYVFIRGIDPPAGPLYGIYRDLPSWELVQALGKALIPGFTPEQ